MTSKLFSWREAVRRVRDYLAMQGQLARTASQDASWAAARDAVRRSVQLRESAELLLARGSKSDGIRLVLESLGCLKGAAAVLAGGDATWGLAVQGASQESAGRRAARLVQEGERRAMRLEPAPPLEDQVTPDHAAAAQELVALELGLERTLHEALLDRRGLLRLRRQRWGFAALVLLSPFVAVAMLRAVLYGVSAGSSSNRSDQFTADRAVDGDPATAWEPNGGDDQWLELRFRSRRVHRVRVLNGDSRAARGVRMELYAGTTRLATETKEFPAESPAGWLVFDVPNLRGDRIRLVITSHYGAGGGIAEAEVN